MKIVMSGATGFIGTNLVRAFRERGWEVSPLGRENFKQDDEIFLENFICADVVVNLAGASIMARWTDEYKRTLYSSRIETTKKIVRAIKRMKVKPKLFISTSAIGFYDTREVHTEDDTTPFDDFLGNLAFDWEQTAIKAREAGVRTVIFRFGIVLGRGGGALQQMLIPFKMGLGGTIGDGGQPFSWVHMDDLVRAYMTVIEHDQYDGIYNLTAPHPTTNKGLTKALGKVLHRPTVMHVPNFVLKLQLGEAANILLQGQAVLPKRLLESGFTFKFTEIDKAIEDLLGK